MSRDQDFSRNDVIYLLVMGFIGPWPQGTLYHFFSRPMATCVKTARIQLQSSTKLKEEERMMGLFEQELRCKGHFTH